MDGLKLRISQLVGLTRQERHFAAPIEAVSHHPKGDQAKDDDECGFKKSALTHGRDFSTVIR